MKRNKLLALALTAVLTLGLLSGCGGGGDKSGSSAAGEGDQSAAGSPAAGVELNVVTS